MLSYPQIQLNEYLYHLATELSLDPLNQSVQNAIAGVQSELLGYHQIAMEYYRSSEHVIAKCRELSLYTQSSYYSMPVTTVNPVPMVSQLPELVPLTTVTPNQEPLHALIPVEEPLADIEFDPKTIRRRVTKENHQLEDDAVLTKIYEMANQQAIDNTIRITKQTVADSLGFSFNMVERASRRLRINGYLERFGVISSEGLRHIASSELEARSARTYTPLLATQLDASVTIEPEKLKEESMLDGMTLRKLLN